MCPHHMECSRNGLAVQHGRVNECGLLGGAEHASHTVLFDVHHALPRPARAAAPDDDTRVVRYHRRIEHVACAVAGHPHRTKLVCLDVVWHRYNHRRKQFPRLPRGFGQRGAVSEV